MIVNPLNVIDYIFKNRHNLNKWVKIYSVLWILWTINWTFICAVVLVSIFLEIDKDPLDFYEDIFITLSTLFIFVGLVVLPYIPINFMYKLGVDEKITTLRNPLSALLSVFGDKSGGMWWMKIYSVLWILWAIFWAFICIGAIIFPEINGNLLDVYVILFIFFISFIFVVSPFIPIYWIKGIKIEKLIKPKSLSSTTLHTDLKVYKPIVLLLLVILVISVVGGVIYEVVIGLFFCAMFGFCLWIVWHFYTVEATCVTLYRALLKAKRGDELLFLGADYLFFNLNTNHVLKTTIYFVLFIFGVSVPIMELIGDLDLYKISQALIIDKIDPANIHKIIEFITMRLFGWGFISLFAFSVFVIPSKLLLDVVNIRRFNVNEKTIERLSLWSYIEEFIRFTAVFSLLLLIFKIKEGYYIYSMITQLLILITLFAGIGILAILFYIRFSLKVDIEELIQSFKKEGILSENVNINQILR